MSTSKKRRTEAGSDGVVNAAERARAHFETLVRPNTGAGRLPIVDGSCGAEKVMAILLSHFIPKSVRSRPDGQAAYMDPEVLYKDMADVCDASRKIRAVMPYIFTDAQIEDMGQISECLAKLDPFVEAMDVSTFVNACRPTADPAMPTVVMASMDAMVSMAQSVVATPVEQTAFHTSSVVRQAAARTMMAMQKIGPYYSPSHQDYAKYLIDELVRMGDVNSYVHAVDQAAVSFAQGRKVLMLCKRPKIVVGQAHFQQMTRFYHSKMTRRTPCMNGAECIGNRIERIKREGGTKSGKAHDKCIVAFRTPEDVADPRARPVNCLCILCILDMYNYIVAAASMTRSDTLVLSISSLSFVTSGPDGFPPSKMHKLTGGTNGAAFHGVDGALLSLSTDDLVYNDGTDGNDPGLDWSPQLSADFQ